MIQRGKTAVLSSTTFNEIDGVAQRFGGANPVPFGMGKQMLGKGLNAFPALITGNASLATNRWKYAFNEVLLTNTDTTRDLDGDYGRSGTTTSGYAINLAEMNHTSTYAWGIDTTGTDYPAGFAARPIGGAGANNDHKYDVAVIMYETLAFNGDGQRTVYFFDLMGSHDGTCSA